MQLDVISKADIMNGKMGLAFAMEIGSEKKKSYTLFVMHST
jgi:hypothetical protein